MRSGTGEENPWIRLFGHAYPRVAFIVFEQHVIAGLILLYKAVFEVKSIFLAAYHIVAKVADVFYQNIGSCHGVNAIEIATYPATQVFSFSHIDNRAIFVVVAIYARSIGQ